MRTLSSLRCFYLAAVLWLAVTPSILLGLWTGVPWLLLTFILLLLAIAVITFPLFRARDGKAETFWLAASLPFPCSLAPSLLPKWGLLPAYGLLWLFLPLYLWLITPTLSWLLRRFPLLMKWAPEKPEEFPQWSRRTWTLVLPLFLLMNGQSLLLAHLLKEGRHSNSELVEAIDELGLPLLTQAQYTCLAMRENYLWQDKIPALPGLCSGNPEALLTQSKVEHDYWSRVLEPTSAVLAKTAKVNHYNFGARFDFNRDEVFITDVEANSPAAKTGMRRGDRIVAMDGRPVDKGTLFLLRLTDLSYQLTLRGADGQLREIKWQPGEYESATLPEQASVLEHQGRRIGYLQYRHFTPGANAALDAEIARLKSASIQDLVVDLRHNGGGYTQVAQHLGTAIGGKRVADKRMVTERSRTHGKEQQFELRFDPLANQPVLDLPRVVFLTSDGTASASEQLIYGLSRHFEVITIGGRTYGKPYSLYPSTYRGRTWLLVTAAVLDDRGAIAYPQGIAPTCAVKDDGKGEYGDAKETLLSAALEYLNAGQCPASKGN